VIQPLVNIAAAGLIWAAILDGHFTHRPMKNPAAPTQHAISTVTRGLLPAILEPDWERLTVTRGSPENDLQ